MANTIGLRKEYVPMLDEKLRVEAKTSVLDGASDLAREGANADELVIPKLDMSGLKNYDRNSGYLTGDVNMTYETVKANFDRGISFNVDAMDDQETAGLAFGRLAGEFIRTQVAPEKDAFNISTYAQKAAENPSSHAEANITTGDQAIKALRVADTYLNNQEVPTSERYLFCTYDFKGLIDDMDTIKSKKILDRYIVVEVPQNRMVTKIKQLDGKTSKQEKGGWQKDTEGGAKDLNFLIVQKDAVIQFNKHKAPKVISPEVNQKADGWTFDYRDVSIAEVYENKAAGIYAHNATV